MTGIAAGHRRATVSSGPGRSWSGGSRLPSATLEATDGAAGSSSSMRTRQEGSAQVLRRYQDVPGRIAETLRSVARRAQLDRGVSFALVGRAWQMVAGPGPPPAVPPR